MKSDGCDLSCLNEQNGQSLSQNTMPCAQEAIILYNSFSRKQKRNLVGYATIIFVRLPPTFTA